jgi:hypothetical protein
MKPERHTEGSPETLTTPDLDRHDAGEVAANFVKTGSKSEKLGKSEKFKASSLACAPETRQSVARYWKARKAYSCAWASTPPA